MLDEYYPLALESGISAERFWDLTFREIVDSIEAYTKAKNREARHEIDKLFVLAEAIASRISYIFDTNENKADYTDYVQMPWDFYPDLYGKTREAKAEDRQNAVVDNQRQSRRAYAERWNRKFRGE